MYTLYFDGAMKKDGRAGAGFVLFDDDQNEVIRGNHNLTGVRGVTSNYCEYIALIGGMQCAKSLGLGRFLVKGDSQLVINQIFGTWRIKAQNLAPLARKCIDLRNNCWIEGKWISRNFNSLADELANRACRQDIVPAQDPQWWAV